MGLTLKKYTPLPDLTVQGNNYQAPNISIAPNVAPAQNISFARAPVQNIGLPAPANRNLPTSWSRPITPPPSFVNRHLFQPTQDFISNANNSMNANLIRLATANITQNPTARSNASIRLKQSERELSKQVRSPNTALALTGEGGLGEVGKPKVTGSVPSEAEFNRMIPAVKGIKVPGAQDSANLSPKDQMAQAKLEGMGPPSKAEIDTGLKANPYKSNVTPTEAGNFTGARLSGGAVSDPIRVAGRIADYHMGQVGRDAPALYDNFWKTVEGGKVPDNAPPSLKPALQWFREVSNGVHKESNALGTPTRYKQNWELRAASIKDVNPEQVATGQLGSVVKHTIQRKYATHAEFEAAAEKAGLAVEKDPRVALRKYVSATTSALERKSIAKSLAEADAGNMVKPHTLDLGWGTTVPLSDEGLRMTKGVQLKGPSGKTVSLYDAINSMAKGSLLSLSQFHTFNVGLLRAGASLAMPKPGNLLHGDLTAGSHPVRAARGAYGLFRPLAPGGEKYVINNLADAYQRGDIAFASAHGVPFGKTSYGELGGKFNIGHKMVFEKQLPMMHKEIVGAMRDTMKTYNLTEGSLQALELGKVMNATMGFMNRQAMNVSPAVSKGIDRAFLAGQFTPSKAINLKKAFTSGGAAGSYARADVAANALAAAALIGGIGYLLKQKSDSTRDIALRTLINPAIPTNSKDKKGNTQEVRIPLTYTAEVAHILGIKLVRQPDGHLGIDFHAGNIPGTAGEWAKARLSPAASAVVKLKTNTNFANKPLYDPNAPAGTKVAQAGTTLLQGVLPIGAQGLPYAKTVNKHLPGSVQDVLDAGAPGSNPLLKSGLSSVGFTPRTDQTVGKGLASSQYFNGRDKFVGSLKPNDKNLFNTVNPVKKNPLTGQPVYDATIFNKASNYNLLADNPQFTDKYQRYQQSQPSHDPLWDLPRNQLQSVLLLRGGKTFPAQTYTKAGASLYQAVGADQPWYQNFVKHEQAFYSNLPAGTGSGSNIDYGPQQSPYVSQQLAAGNTKDPQVQQYFNDRAAYENGLRAQTGLKPIAPFGKVGVPGQLDNPGRLAITPKGSSYGTGASKKSKTSKTTTSKTSSSKSSKRTTSRTRSSSRISAHFNPNRVTIKLSSGGKVSTPTISVPKSKAKVAKKRGAAKPKVALKSLRV